MREDLKSMYQRLGYKKGFSLGEVFSSLQRKKLIDIHNIVSEDDHVERKQIFDEGSLLHFFYMHECILKIT